MKTTIIICMCFTSLMITGQNKVINAVNLPNFELKTDCGDAECPNGWGGFSKNFLKFSASSELQANSKLNINYSPINLSDKDLNSSWVDGKDDYGINETISFKVDTGFFNPSLDYEYFNGKFHFINGVYKTINLYNANSRVKRFELLHNGVKVCDLSLNDFRGVQKTDASSFFDFSEIPVYANDVDAVVMLKDLNEVKLNPKTFNLNIGAKFKIKVNDVITLKILEVYPGLKWKDTAITEIFIY